MAETIQKLLSLKPPKVFKTKESKDIPHPDSILLYGVELEIENCPDGPDHAHVGFSAKEDGSLRNNGWEFVSHPMDFNNLAYCLTNFFQKNKFNAENYSDRCSVHVHANCLDLTVDQLAAVLLQYQTFEELLYKFVGQDRDKNIFCIPWSETQLTYNFVNDLEKDLQRVRRWQKYTGLNILPLRQFGTIEFRQMGGEYDVVKILNWLRIIGCMFAFARANTLADIKRSIMEVNTTSAYSNLMDRVFGNYSGLLKSPGYETALENGVLNLKYMILEEGKAKDPLMNFNERVEEILRAERELRVPRARPVAAGEPAIAAQIRDLELRRQEANAQGQINAAAPRFADIVGGGNNWPLDPPRAQPGELIWVDDPLDEPPQF